MSNIRPLHRSIRGRPRIPHNMDRITIPPDMLEGLTTIAMDSWTDCINAGRPFQDALLAVYLSGLENGAEASGGNRD